MRIIAGLILAICIASTAAAQEVTPAAGIDTSGKKPAIRDAVTRIAVVPAPPGVWTSGASTSAPRAQGSRQPMNKWMRALAIAGGGFAGLYAGAIVGSRLEPNCYCDDPGLKGALIGMPIGAAAGAITVAILTR